MSVITKLTEDELSNFLANYSLPSLVSFQGITEGTVNTNYLIKTQGQEAILTIFEYLDLPSVKDYLNLTQALSHKGLPCAPIYFNHLKENVAKLKGKPAALVGFLPGISVDHPSVDQCKQIGRFLAELHIQTQDFETKIKNPMGCEWRNEHATQLLAFCTEQEKQIIHQGLDLQNKIPWEQLPKSTIHYDLFRDNALFEKEKLTGVIDFYYANFDAMLLDLAITLNDWCTNWQSPDLGFNDALFKALFEAYNQQRSLTLDERQQLLPMIQLMAFHFYLTRLNSKYHPPKGDTVTLKSPKEFELIFNQRCHLNHLPIGLV